MHQALAIVEPLGDDGVTARVERALQALYTISGPVDLAREFGRRALAHAESSGEHGVAWSSHWTSAALGGLTANGDEVKHHCAEAARIARELNSPMLAANIAEVQLEFSTASGEWAEGLALAERMIPVARAVSPRALLPRMLVWTGTILLYRGDIERAKAYFDESWLLSRAGAPDATTGDINTLIVAHVGQAAYHLATRNWLGAVEYAQRGLAIGDRYKYVVWSVYRLLPILGEGALWLGDFALAEWVGKRLREEAPKLSDRLGRAYVAALDGLLLRLEHNRPESIPRLLAAADEFEAVNYMFYGARLRRTTAQMMWKLGDRDGATRELRRAHDVFLRLGAASDLHATREEMRQLGVRPPTRTVVPGGVLTDREREIALLVAQHKTNKEIARALDISSRTVSTHLSNVFQKLGVDSRAALTDAIRADAALKS
jgi:DNA-binding CsgD family transcriptional regulator